MKKLLLIAVISAAFLTSCSKEDLTPPASKDDTTYQIRIESIGTNDSVTYSPVIVVK